MVGFRGEDPRDRYSSESRWWHLLLSIYRVDCLLLNAEPVLFLLYGDARW